MSEALDYLLKPYDRERFGQALGRARATVHRLAGSVDERLAALVDELRGGSPHLTRLAVKTAGKVRIVTVADIDFIEASGNYLRLHAKGSSHLLRETMQNIEGRLDPERFIRIHRSTIVNLDQVKQVKPHTNGECFLKLGSGAEVKVSRSYRDVVARFL